MTGEQLQAARMAHWRQNNNPVLTLEDAQAWFERHPLSLFLPKRAQLPVPSPSFVEACLGQANATPDHNAIEQAKELLVRVIASGKVVALDLLGGMGEQPDFIASSEILPFLVALGGDREWKLPPKSSGSHKVSPLAVEAWKLLEANGALTADEVRDRLGREVTEAAVLRALGELWHGFRAIPLPQSGDQPALWELLQLHHRQELAAGSAMSQVTALSLVVSMYLQSVYAATSEEIEIFLSPLASRARIREAVRGLTATRQIQSLSMDANTYYFLEGGLPEFLPIPARREGQPGEEPQAARGGVETGLPQPPAPSRRAFSRSPQAGPRMRRQGQKREFAAQSSRTFGDQAKMERGLERPTEGHRARQDQSERPARTYGKDRRAEGQGPGTAKRSFERKAGGKPESERRPRWQRFPEERKGKSDSGERPWRPQSKEGRGGNAEQRGRGFERGFERAPKSVDRQKGFERGGKWQREERTPRSDQEKAARPRFDSRKERPQYGQRSQEGGSRPPSRRFEAKRPGFQKANPKWKREGEPRSFEERGRTRPGDDRQEKRTGGPGRFPKGPRGDRFAKGFVGQEGPRSGKRGEGGPTHRGKETEAFKGARRGYGAERQYRGKAPSGAKGQYGTEQRYGSKRQYGAKAQYGGERQQGAGRFSRGPGKDGGAERPSPGGRPRGFTPRGKYPKQATPPASREGRPRDFRDKKSGKSTEE